MDKILAISPWILPLIIWLWQQHTKKQIQKELDININKLKKIEILDERTWKAKKALYDNMMSLWGGMLSSDKMKELEKIMKEIQHELPYYSSDSVFKAYLDWRTHIRSGGESVDGVKKLASIFIEIRKEMGYPHTEITHDDFLRIYIDDYKK